MGGSHIRSIFIRCLLCAKEWIQLNRYIFFEDICLFNNWERDSSSYITDLSVPLLTTRFSLIGTTSDMIGDQGNDVSITSTLC